MSRAGRRWPSYPGSDTRPLAEPDMRRSPHPALHGYPVGAGCQAGQGWGCCPGRGTAGWLSRRASPLPQSDEIAGILDPSRQLRPHVRTQQADIAAAVPHQQRPPDTFNAFAASALSPRHDATVLSEEPPLLARLRRRGRLNVRSAASSGPGRSPITTPASDSCPVCSFAPATPRANGASLRVGEGDAVPGRLRPPLRPNRTGVQSQQFRSPIHYLKQQQNRLPDGLGVGLQHRCP